MLSTISIIVTVVGEHGPRQDRDRTWNVGAGTMLWLGGRGPGGQVPPGVVVRGGIVGLGETMHCISKIKGSSSSYSIFENAQSWACGVGVCDRVFGHAWDDIACMLGIWAWD